MKIIDSISRYSSSVERQLPKLERRVRFPLSAFYNAHFTAFSECENEKGNQKGNQLLFR